MIRDTSAQDHLLTANTAHSSWRNRWLVITATVALLIGAMWLAQSWLSASVSVAQQRLRIATVTRGDLVRDLVAEGKVISANNPTLYAIAPGVVTLQVVAGDVVKQGQALAEIDSPELRSKLVQEEASLAGLVAQASRAALDAQLAQSAASKLVDQAKLERTATTRDVQRYQSGYDGGAVPLIDLLKAKDELQRAEIGLQHANEDAQLQVQSAQLEARNQQLLVERQRAIVAETRRQVAALTLRAPFDGQVGQVQAEQYANVALNAPVLSVLNLSVFEVEFTVPESFARDLTIGMPAEVSSGGGQPYAADVAAISPEVVNSEVTGRLRFREQQPLGLRQSQRLSVRLVMGTQRNVLQVERGPFVEQGGGHYAYVMQDDVAVRRPVQLGVSSLTAVEVLTGLTEGDRVVISGSDVFDDAKQVQVN